MEHDKVLVTGGCGFVGKHLCRRLSDAGRQVTALDVKPQEIEGVEVVKGDICDAALVGKLLQDTRAVYHLAAVTTFEECRDNPSRAMHVNVYGTQLLLKAASNAQVKRFIFFSAAGVYGETKEAIKHEKMTLSPPSVYGSSKLTGELLCRAYNAQSGPLCVCLRLFNVYGPSGRGVINRFLKAAASHKKVIIYGDGDQVRDYIHVDDVVRATIALGSRRLTGAYNIGTGKGHSVNYVKSVIEKAAGVTLVADFLPRNAWDLRAAIAATGKAAKLMGQTITLEEGIKRTLDECYR